MPSTRSLRSALFIALGVIPIVAFVPSSVASALPTTPTTAVRHVAPTTTQPAPPDIQLLPPTTVVLAAPVVAAASGSAVIITPPPPPRAPVAAQAEALPHTL
jgi:hypothetical protein